MTQRVLTEEERAERRRKSREYYQKTIERRREYDRARYHKNRERVLARQRPQKAAVRATMDGRISLILQYARRRAKKRNVEFTLDRDWVEARLREQGERCLMTGLPFVYDGGVYHPRQPSLDRIEPTRGYTSDNTRVVCWMWNSAKGAASDDQVLEFCRAVVGVWG